MDGQKEPTEWETVVVNRYSASWMRIFISLTSFFSSSSSYSSSKPTSSQQAISVNDLRSFPDLASAIQRIMNNALTLKLQK